MKWKWPCALGSFSIAIVSCTMREAESPAIPASGPPIERPTPDERLTPVSPGVATLSADTDRAQFDAHLTDELATIDARIRQVSRLYDDGPAEEKDRMSARWQTVLSKRAAIDGNRHILALAVGGDWAQSKADLMANLSIFEDALDDVEFVFNR